MILRGNRFRVPGYSEVHFTNKHNLTLAASSQHHLKLEGLIDVPGTFEVRNAQVTQSNEQARIDAHRLILTNVDGFGTKDQSIHTDVEEANIRLGRANIDRKSTRLNSSHVAISYAVFCLKKKRTVQGLW